MSRYFLEISYKGTAYSGFQTQENAITIQSEVEKAFMILQREPVSMTGSSRTDAGVHALQNYFHFDFEQTLHPQFIYKMNAILPDDIVLHRLIPVHPDAHCRFDALDRQYEYTIYASKNPFLEDRAFYYPYKLDLERMQEAAWVVMEYEDFTSFSKRNTQVKTFRCRIMQSEWVTDQEKVIYRVKANRFLRGMVRGLTGTMLLVGRGKITIDNFREIIIRQDNRLASFAVPGRGLFLTQVHIPYFSVADNR